MTQQSADEILVYVGSSPQVESGGIYAYRLIPSSGALEFASKAAGLDSPTFLALHPQERHLYSVNEVQEVAGEPTGAVTSFSIDPETGALTPLNQQLSQGPGPCHLSVDETARHLLVANYSGGSVCILPIRPDGQLEAATDFIQHHGSSVNPQRQQAPHPHSIVVGPANRYAFVPDLGLDKIMIYKLDLEHGKLVPNVEPWAQVKPGAGPRHFTFHPDGEHAYVINELDSTVTAFTYDGTRGTLTEFQTISALPDDYQGTSYCADIHVSASGRFLYGSNRGHDSIVIFAVDPGTGELSCVGHEPTRGEYPWNFALDPTGALLVVANWNTDNITSFYVDPQTGMLVPTGHVTEVPRPRCVKILTLSS